MHLEILEPFLCFTFILRILKLQILLIYYLYLREKLIDIFLVVFEIVFFFSTDSCAVKAVFVSYAHGIFVYVAMHYMTDIHLFFFLILIFT